MGEAFKDLSAFAIMQAFAFFEFSPFNYMT